MVDIATGPGGILEVCHWAEYFAEGFLDRIRHISAPLGTTDGIEVDSKAAEQAGEFTWFVVECHEGESIIDRTSFADDVRVEFARIPAYGAIFHKESAVEGQLFFFSDSKRNGSIFEVRGSIEDALSDSFGKSDHVLLGFIGLVTESLAQPLVRVVEHRAGM